MIRQRIIIYLNICASLLLIAEASYAVTYENLTENTRRAANRRQQIIKKVRNDGVRLAWDGLKEMNKVYKPGHVDAAIEHFEIEMIKRFEQSGMKGIEIKKMDFKGYYITCGNKPICTAELETFIKKLPPGKIGNGIDFNLVSARASNYQEGYIKARARASYQTKTTNNLQKPINRKKKDFHKFIDDELKRAMQLAADVDDINKIRLDDPKLTKELTLVIEKMRGGKSVPKELEHYKPLVKALDTLLETPFATSNNLDKSLTKAIDPSVKAIPPTKFIATTAISGDDLFVVIKDVNGKVIKIVGADARGLGVINMTTRYKEVLAHFKNGKEFTSIKDVLDLSKNAMKQADKKMAASVERYVKFIKESIEHSETTVGNINDVLEEAHRNYHRDAVKDTKLMIMRTTSVPGCKGDNKCILNSVTVVHNLLKKLEAQGKDGHFGDSCLSVQYWLMRAEVGVK